VQGVGPPHPRERVHEVFEVDEHSVGWSFRLVDLWC
jgi:hypothetical protein